MSEQEQALEWMGQASEQEQVLEWMELELGLVLETVPELALPAEPAFAGYGQQSCVSHIHR